MTTNILTAIITAYCACKVCCGPNAKGINASGKKPTESHSIAASRRIPFGSKIRIGRETFTVDDRLAKKYDSRFDIYMRDHREAKKFGIRTNKVIIITP